MRAHRQQNADNQWRTAYLQRTKRMPQHRTWVFGEEGPEYTEEQLKAAREYHYGA